MKKIYVLFFFFLILNSFSQKKGVVIYECSLKAEKFLNGISKTKDKTIISYENEIISAIKQSKPIEFKLSFNENESSFEYIKGLQNENNRFNILAIKYGRHKYYFNKIKNKNILQKKAFGELFLIDFSHKKIKWTLLKETKTIKGITYFKATTLIKYPQYNKKVIAWYDPNINLNIGPLNFNSLPGLIVELSITEPKFTTIFKLKKISFENKKSIKEPVKGKKVTLEEFEEIGKEIMKNLKNK